MAMPAVYVTKYIIIGRPYRTASRIMKLGDDYKTRRAAEKARTRLVDAGELDPYAFVRKQTCKG